MQGIAAFFPGANRAFGDHDIVFFGHARNRYNGAAYKRIGFNFFVEGLLAHQVEHSGDVPLHVLRQAGQNLRMVAFPEAVHVYLNGSLVL